MAEQFPLMNHDHYPVHYTNDILKSVKVIALSIHSDRRFVVSMLKSGACGYLLKDRIAAPDEDEDEDEGDEDDLEDRDDEDEDERPGTSGLLMAKFLEVKDSLYGSMENR